VPITDNTSLTPREYQLAENDKEERRETFTHAINIKKMELELARENHAADIELKKLEAKWDSWISLPRYVLKLPVMFLFGIAYIFHAITKSTPSQDFWDFLKR